MCGSVLKLMHLYSTLAMTYSVKLGNALALVIIVCPASVSLSPTGFPNGGIINVFLLVINLTASVTSTVCF